jgi:starvation-inducible DNA-binding protein
MNTTSSPDRTPISAPAELTDSLQRVLVDLVALHVTLKQAHWTVRGPGFRSLHLALDEVVAEAREHSDTVAERLRALRAVPDGRLSTVAATTTLTEFPLGEVDSSEVIPRVTEMLAGVAAVIGEVHDTVDEADPTSADLLHVIVEGLEKHAWLIGAEGR